MKKLRSVPLWILFLWVISGHYSAAQTNSDAEKKVIETYFQSAGDYTPVYSGKEQAKYPLYYRNHPYYKTDKYQDGTLSFEGIVYPDVKLRLDLYKEEVTIQTLNTRYNIIVPNDRLDYACIGPDYITRNIPHNENNTLPQGLYIRIYDGLYPVWLKQTCPLRDNIEDGAVTYTFYTNKKVYIYKEGKYHRVSNKNSVLKLFPSHKKELKQYIKSYQLNFKQSPETAVVELVKEYELLNAL